MTGNISKFEELLKVVACLRAEKGCPWDKQQTPLTLKPYLLEELHELLEAIDSEEPSHIMEELGDLMFLAVFVAQIYGERQLFSINDALSAITTKMIRRHPHVFDDQPAGSEKELRRRWLAVKEMERKGKDIPPPTELPKSLPALHKAQRVAEQAKQKGFSWPPPDDALREIAEKVDNLRTALTAGQLGQDDLSRSLGSLFFMLANLGRMVNINAENALSAAIRDFTTRLAQSMPASANPDSPVTKDQPRTPSPKGRKTKKN